MIQINGLAILIAIVLFIGWIVVVASFIPESRSWNDKALHEQVAYVLAIVVLPMASTLVTFYYIGELIVSFFM